MQEPDAEWIVREERVATQPPDPAMRIRAGQATDPRAGSLVQVSPERRSAGPGRVRLAQSVTRRVPSYDYRTVTVIRYLIAVLEVLLAIRFFLHLLGASPNSLFSTFVLGVTYPFLIPFEGTFGHPSQGLFVLDSSALVALIIYPLLGWALGGLIRIRTARRDPWDDSQV
jgi:uncharacterized protein YggT (Ycf19 family)